MSKTAAAAPRATALRATILSVLATILATVSATTAAEGLEVSRPYRLSPNVAPGERHMGIRLLGSVELEATSKSENE